MRLKALAEIYTLWYRPLRTLPSTSAVDRPNKYASGIRARNGDEVHDRRDAPTGGDDESHAREVRAVLPAHFGPQTLLPLFSGLLQAENCF